MSRRQSSRSPANCAASASHTSCLAKSCAYDPYLAPQTSSLSELQAVLLIDTTLNTVESVCSANSAHVAVASHCAILGRSVRFRTIQLIERRIQVIGTELALH